LPSLGASDNRGLLNQSLSSAFFQGIRSARNSQANTDENAAYPDDADKGNEAEEAGHSLPPPPPAAVYALSATEDGARPSSSSVELKRRETMAAVNQMKDRLRGMGLLRAANELTNKNGSSPSVTALDNSTASSIDLIAPSDLSASQVLGQQLKERTEKCRRAMR
jgi:hypothetical protein